MLHNDKAFLKLLLVSYCIGAAAEFGFIGFIVSGARAAGPNSKLMGGAD